MEVIIAVIGGVCTLASSLASVYADRKYQNHKDEVNTEQGIKYHNVISNINFWIKSEIPNTDYGREYIEKFLVIRLTLVKENIKKFLDIDTKNAEYDYISMKLSDLLNGENEFKDLQLIHNYPGIPEDFVKKFNKWDNRSDLILMYYLKSITYDTNHQLIYHFLNVYTAALSAMINSLISNLDILVDGSVNKNVMIRNRFKKIFNDFNDKTNIDNVMKSVLNENEYDKFLFRFNNKGIITYCSKNVNVLLYNLENLIGAHIMTLVSQENMHDLINFMNDKKSILYVKIHGKDDKYHNVIIKQLSSDSKLNMCFLL